MPKLDIDLDEIVGKVAGKPKTVGFRGETFDVPAEIPMAFLVELSRFSRDSVSASEAVRAGAIVAIGDALQRLLGPEGWERFCGLSPTQEHMMALVNAASEMYAELQAGESGGSAGSSRSTRAPRKRTSNASTPSTSVEPEPISDASSG
ncbi:MAG: hypothetical protein ACRDH7_09300 [Actinomycetota bacterium]